MIAAESNTNNEQDAISTYGELEVKVMIGASTIDLFLVVQGGDGRMGAWLMIKDDELRSTTTTSAGMINDDE